MLSEPRQPPSRAKAPVERAQALLPVRRISSSGFRSSRLATTPVAPVLPVPAACLCSNSRVGALAVVQLSSRPDIYSITRFLTRWILGRSFFDRLRASNSFLESSSLESSFPTVIRRLEQLQQPQLHIRHTIVFFDFVGAATCLRPRVVLQFLNSFKLFHSCVSAGCGILRYPFVLPRSVGPKSNAPITASRLVPSRRGTFIFQNGCSISRRSGQPCPPSSPRDAGP